MSHTNTLTYHSHKRKKQLRYNHQRTSSNPKISHTILSTTSIVNQVVKQPLDATTSAAHTVDNPKLQTLFYENRCAFLRNPDWRWGQQHRQIIHTQTISFPNTRSSTIKLSAICYPITNQIYFLEFMAFTNTERKIINLDHPRSLEHRTREACSYCSWLQESFWL